MNEKQGEKGAQVAQLVDKGGVAGFPQSHTEENKGDCHFEHAGINTGNHPPE